MSISRIKKCLAAKIPWEYKCGVLIFRDGQFKACVIIANETPVDKKEIFRLLNLPCDTNYYTAKEVADVETELYATAGLSGALTCKAPAYKPSRPKGLETRNKLIQLFTQRLSSLEQKYVHKHIPEVIGVHNLLMQHDWTHCSELEDIENKLNKVIRKYFSPVIKLDKDTCYDTSLEAFIVALKNY